MNLRIYLGRAVPSVVSREHSVTLPADITSCALTLAFLPRRARKYAISHRYKRFLKDWEISWSSWGKVRALLRWRLLRRMSSFNVIAFFWKYNEDYIDSGELLTVYSNKANEALRSSSVSAERRPGALHGAAFSTRSVKAPPAEQVQ